ncbi:FixH family protein [Xanthobacter agilis]|uniref:Nitrogen fixation protein FixH n=1 Tax=Xanthobacter agilis TaxID=47492 RepID=A0ABU0LDW6_XANAG|nr:FixH family protein [Xanthobacter agilis]MDQ0505321.1 nitrogen fixation protein FixH [Xanthobacter agilis]
MTAADKGTRRPREITGAMVLAGLLAFFALVMTVNFTMARFAVSTFAGLETESSYKAGLAFSKESDAAEAQQARHWAVEVDLESPGGTRRTVEVRALDAAGKPLSNLDADGRFAHPTDARRDVVLEVRPLGDGRYSASAEVGPGQWDLVIDFSQGADRLFRSKNRVQLP